MTCDCGPVCKCKTCLCRDCSCVYDVVVVGAGIIGSATAYTLAKAGQKTLLLEQFPLPHTRGSSHGATRIIRQAYRQSFIARVIPDAFRLWRRLEQESSSTLLEKSELLVFSRNRAPLIKLFLEGLNSVAKDKGKPEKPLLSYKELTQMYPKVIFYLSDTGCYDEDAGILYADRCLLAYQGIFQSMGGVIRDSEKLLNIKPGEVLELITDKGVIRSRRLVVCPGSWAPQLLPQLGLQNNYRCEAIQVCYWKAKDNSTDLRKHPIFLDREQSRESYGLPSKKYPGLMKIDLHYGVDCDPDRTDIRKPEEETHMAQLKHLITERFPYIDPEPVIKERCIYTMTPDKTCVVDRHPKYDNIAYAAGFSGQGFKLAPIIGVMLTDLVLKRTPTYRIREFDAERFNKQSKLYKLC